MPNTQVLCTNDGSFMLIVMEAPARDNGGFSDYDEATSKTKTVN
jgi:hypothetical protein